MSNTGHRKQNYAFVSPSFHSIDGVLFLAGVDEICIKMKELHLLQGCRLYSAVSKSGVIFGKPNMLPSRDLQAVVDNELARVRR